MITINKSKKLREVIRISEKVMKRRLFYIGETLLDKYEVSIELPIGFAFGMSKKILEIVKGNDKIEYFVREIFRGNDVVGFIIDEVIKSVHPDGSKEIKEYSYILSKEPLKIKLVNATENKSTALPVDSVEEKYLITIKELL